MERVTRWAAFGFWLGSGGGRQDADGPVNAFLVWFTWLTLRGSGRGRWDADGAGDAFLIWFTWLTLR
jgi:hypothetical protein